VNVPYDVSILTAGPLARVDAVRRNTGRTVQSRGVQPAATFVQVYTTNTAPQQFRPLLTLIIVMYTVADGERADRKERGHFSKQKRSWECVICSLVAVVCTT
jgi:hypothetical protein